MGINMLAMIFNINYIVDIEPTIRISPTHNLYNIEITGPQQAFRNLVTILI